MRILVVDDEPKELAKIVAKLRNGWEAEGTEDALEIVEAGSVEAVRELIERHREDKDWVLHHVFSDGLARPGGWGFGCEDVSRLVRLKGPNGSNPNMTIVSNFLPSEIAKELGAGLIFKSELDDDPSLLIRRLLPPAGRPPEMR